jgi:hypothetical protein
MMILTYVRMCLIALIITATSIEGILAQSSMQKIQMDFTMPNGYVRHLLLGFTPNNAASDGIDYGYDALNIDTFPDDLNWMIEDKRYVIQGVGAFDDTKKYNLGLFLENSGAISIDLKDTYNFQTPIDVYIYDNLLDTYTNINDSNYEASMDSGEYLDRFYIAFKDANFEDKIANFSLNTDENNLEDTKVSYLKNTQELYINTNDKFTIKNINVFNLLGQEIVSLSHVNSTLIKIPLQTNKTKFGIVIIETEQGGFFSKKIAIN